MPDGNTPATAGKLIQLLERADDLIQRADYLEAVPLIRDAKQLAALGPSGNETDEDDDEQTVYVGHLVGTGHDSIHYATCMLEYLSDIESKHTPSGIPSDDLMHGRYLIGETITQLLRFGLQQLDAEHRAASRGAS